MPSGRRRTVLVVEDDLSTRVLLDALLTNGVVQCMLTPDAATAKAALIGPRVIDCIVLDHFLPDRDEETGLAVAEVAHGLHIPVVLFSGFITPWLQGQYEALGLVAAFHKPADLLALRDTVRRAVGITP